MPALEMLSLISVTVGIAAILRFAWLDSLRFSERTEGLSRGGRVTPRTAQRLALEADAARVLAETESLPKAA